MIVVQLTNITYESTFKIQTSIFKTQEINIIFQLNYNYPYEAKLSKVYSFDCGGFNFFNNLCTIKDK